VTTPSPNVVVPIGLSPYISPTTLQAAPTGIDFTTIPAMGSITFDPAANTAELWNMCARATSMADQYCSQLLRATTDVEVMRGPDYRVTVGPQAGGASATPYWTTCGSNARLIMSRWPVLNVSQVKVSSNASWPRQWQTLPTGYAEPELPPYGIYNSIVPTDDAYGGQGVIMAPGYVDWTYGRNGYVIEVTYQNGWPHCTLTGNATAGSTALAVSDTTGWSAVNYVGSYTGATGVIRDGGLQEAVTCVSASTSAGPGTIYTSSAINYAHEIGTVFTTLPASVEQACILFCCAQALVRGATSTSIHSMGGHSQSSQMDIGDLNSEAELLLHPFKRTI
jgi:hypothetical protein